MNTLYPQEAARRSVEAIAPDELDYFDDVTAAWAKQELAFQRGSRRLASGTIGIGVDVSLVSEAVYAVISGAAAEVLGTVAVAAWRQRRWWHRRPARDAIAAPVALSDADSEALQAACRRHGLTLGLSPEQADLLADAVYGSIRRTDGG
jgi:hypothetical protein